MQVSIYHIHVNRLTEFCQDIFFGVIVAILGHLFKGFEGFFGQFWKQRVSQAQLTINFLSQHSLQERRGLGHGCLGPKHMINKVISTWVTYRKYVYNIKDITLLKKGEHKSRHVPWHLGGRALVRVVRVHLSLGRGLHRVKDGDCRKDPWKGTVC